MHVYQRDGKKYPSVTTILGCLGGEGLLKWANTLGLNGIRYAEYMANTADYGTYCHECLRRAVDPTVTDPPSAPRYAKWEQDAVRLIDNFHKFMEKYGEYETLATEKPIISDKLGYAGTCDWIVKISGYTILIDFKTSKRVKLNHFLQLGGYFNLLEDEGIYHINGAGILIANLNTGISLHLISRDDVAEFGKTFQHLWEYYYAAQLSTTKSNPEFTAKLTKP